MAKFVFRFQSMLNVKEKLQEQKEAEFGKAIQSLEYEKKKYDEIDLNRQNSILALKERINTKISPKEVSEYNSYINKLKNDLSMQKKVIVKAENLVELKRLELQNAIMETKKYEKLKEKDYELYMEEQKIKENQALDEVVTYRYTNNKE